MTDAQPFPRAIADAIAAGAIAGIAIVVCFAVMNGLVLRTPDFTLAGWFAFAASALVGKVAFTSTSYVALGIGLHFVVAIGWALGYAIAAQRQKQLLTRPVISGAAFGVIVYFAMQLVLVAADLYRIPTPGELGVALLAHTVFYGIPIAFIIARLHRPA